MVHESQGFFSSTLILLMLQEPARTLVRYMYDERWSYTDAHDNRDDHDDNNDYNSIYLSME